MKTYLVPILPSRPPVNSPESGILSPVLSSSSPKNVACPGFLNSLVLTTTVLVIAGDVLQKVQKDQLMHESSKRNVCMIQKGNGP